MLFDRPFMKPVREGSFAYREYSFDVFPNSEGSITLLQEQSFGLGGERLVVLVEPKDLPSLADALRQIQRAADNPASDHPLEVALESGKVYLSESNEVCLLGPGRSDPIVIQPYRIPVLIGALQKACADLA